MERTNGLELARSVGPRHNVRCRFVKGAPRNFLSPAILLLLAEEPQHGYRLSKALRGFGFGRVDRSSIYRALRDLERDGLLSCSVAAPIADPPDACAHSPKAAARCSHVGYSS
jgi:hypothetical protein